MNVEKLRKAISENKFEWRRHALQRMAERGIRQVEVLEVLLNGELIEDYPDDKPFPSALFLGHPRGRPLHVVVAFDEKGFWAYYEPSLNHFEPNFRTRRRRR